MSPRKWKAVLMNLAKARRTPRNPASYLRSRHNATRHGLFIRHLEGSFAALGEDPRQFIRLGGLLLRVFAPRDATEHRLVRRLAEALWRHFRVYRAIPRWTLDELGRRLRTARNLWNLEQARSSDWSPQTRVEETEEEAYQIMRTLIEPPKIARRQRLTLNEVERTLRLLLVYRSGNPRFKFHFTGRRYQDEILELSPNPGDWPRKYAAGAPVGGEQ